MKKNIHSISREDLEKLRIAISQMKEKYDEECFKSFKRAWNEATTKTLICIPSKTQEMRVAIFNYEKGGVAHAYVMPGEFTIEEAKKLRDE